MISELSLMLNLWNRNEFLRFHPRDFCCKDSCSRTYNEQAEAELLRLYKT